MTPKEIYFIINLMPYRKIILAENEIYHVLNRSIDQVPIFSSARECSRFLELLAYYQYKNPPISFSHYARLPIEEKNNLYLLLIQKPKLVEIIAHCLMPNHFHLLLKQLEPCGISKMIGNIQNGYVRFTNCKTHRLGPLFESSFKAVRIEDDEQLLHVSRYIHLNPSTSYLTTIQNLSNYPWSSLKEYLRKQKATLVNTEIVLNLIGGKEKYEQFILNQAEYQRELNKVKHLALEG